MQPSLFTRAPKFDSGTADLTASDHIRLGGQLKVIYAAMADGKWRTVQQIHQLVPQAPENSIQAQLRNLRKKEHGGYTVERRRVGHTSVYRVLP